MPAIRCSGLVKRFADVVAVAGPDLSVTEGECFGLLGPNGAGKTTTILNDALRAVMIDGSALTQLGTPLAIVAAWGLASFGVALAIFRWR